MLLAPHIHWIEGVQASVYAIIEPGGVTLIDTGAVSIDRVDLIFNYLEKHDKYPLDVKRILLTHTDADSAGNAKGIIDETGAIILTSPEGKLILTGSSQPQQSSAVRQWVANSMSRLPSVPEGKIRALDQTNRRLPILGGIDVIPTPGHRGEHVSFYHPESGVLFAGDAIGSHQGKPHLAQNLLGADPAQARRSAIKLLKRCPVVIAPGHGKPIMAPSAIHIHSLIHQLENEA